MWPRRSRALMIGALLLLHGCITLSSFAGASYDEIKNTVKEASQTHMKGNMLCSLVNLQSSRKSFVVFLFTLV